MSTKPTTWRAWVVGVLVLSIIAVLVRASRRRSSEDEHASSLWV